MFRNWFILALSDPEWKYFVWTYLILKGIKNVSSVWISRIPKMRIYVYIQRMVRFLWSSNLARTIPDSEHYCESFRYRLWKFNIYSSWENSSKCDGNNEKPASELNWIQKSILGLFSSTEIGSKLDFRWSHCFGWILIKFSKGDLFKASIHLLVDVIRVPYF